MPKFKIENTKSLNSISKRHFYRLVRNEVNSSKSESLSFNSKTNKKTDQFENSLSREDNEKVDDINVPVCTYNDNLGFEYSGTSFEDELHCGPDIDTRYCGSHVPSSPQPLQVNKSFKEELTSWALKHSIAHTALDDLLVILRKYPIGSDLPKVARTLKKSPRHTNIKIIGDGSYCHFGLANGVEQTLKLHSQLFPYNLNPLNLKVGIDGLSVSNSNTSQLWPILGCLSPSKHVFIIGMYHGYHKPCDSNLYLEDFVQELTHLMKNGIVIDGKRWELKLLCIICDAPAKSFVTKTKGHTGFNSCTKCIQEGEFLNNRVCFPDLHCLLRTDESFVNQEHEDYHLGQSILTTIPNFKLVTEIPLDYMHLICIGVVKKVISFWFHKGNSNVRLSNKEMESITNELLAAVPFIPCEFSRKPRDIKMVSQWKATELRQFLLYTSPIVLKHFLKERSILYDHFMTLHVAIRILTNRMLLNNYGDYAQSLLNYFVETFKILYGTEHVSHNVHGLLHIVNDAKQFGPLDSFSAFEFENYMRLLRMKLKKHDKPLQQLHRRYMESEKNLLFQVEQIFTQNCQFAVSHNNGPLIEMCSSPQYKTYITSTWKLTTSNPDNCVMLEDKTIVLIANFSHDQEGNVMVIIGKQCHVVGPIFTNPCNSTILNCFIVEEQIPSPLMKWPLSRIRSKCVRMPFSSTKFAILPIQHC